MPSAHWAWTLDVSPRKSPACGRHWAPHPEDRHAVLVHHTEHGRATARALRDEYDQGAARLFEGLHLGDLAAFTSTGSIT